MESDVGACVLIRRVVDKIKDEYNDVIKLVVSSWVEMTANGVIFLGFGDVLEVSLEAFF
jgi:hypothetical protein